MIRRALMLGAAWATTAPALAQQHPLDPLTTREHWRVLEILEASGKVTPKTRFTRIALAPPDKAGILADKAPPRLAEVRMKDGASAIEATVDLVSGKVASWRARTDVQPAWLLEEFLGAPVQAVLNHPRFEAMLKARGIASRRFLNCRAMPIGSHAEPRFAGRRVAMVRCDPVNGVQNRFVRRIEGLTAFVDVNSNEVLELSDDAVIPVPETRADYDEAALGKLRDFPTPIAIAQPGGPSFALAGNMVRWGNWSFHLKSDQRVGTVVGRLQWIDGSRTRDVMYEGHLSEIFVPYMDPAVDWYTRTLLDAGEYSMGGLAGALTPGIDCPENASYFDGLVTGDNGRPVAKARVICLFERTTGDMSWRHADIGRPKRELVARMIADLGNYDYVFDWVFESDGQFRIAIGATGIVAAKMAKAKDATGAAGQAEDAHGRFVDDHVIAINHDHYFSFRLDLDVDGPVNSFVRDALETQRLPAEHPRRSIWTSREDVAAREAEGKMSSHGGPALWRVTGSATRNRMGYPASYQLMLGHTAGTLLSRDDVPRQRAGFIDHDLWVTPYAPDERYAAGEYAVLSPPGEGLPKWTAANRPIERTDIVLWPTVGMHHKVRSEDWPVMPVLWHSIAIRPFDFFDRNPALDIGTRP